MSRVRAITWTGEAWLPVFTLSALLLACLGVASWVKPDADADLWARTAVGKLIVETGSVPTQDPFAYTAKRSQWIDHEWGAGVLFYLAARQGGEGALLLLKAALMFGTVVCIWLRSRRLNAGEPALWFHLLIVGSLVFGFFTTVRSQAFTFFFFSLWCLVLEKARDGHWGMAPLIPVTGLVWANVHGGFLAGIGLIVLFALGEVFSRRSPWRFATLAAAAAGGSLVNPYGLSYWTYLLDATQMARPYVREWGSLPLLSLHPLYLGFKLLALLTVVAAAVSWSRREAIDLGELVPLVVTMLLGFRTMRHLTFFVIAAAPFVWAFLNREWRERLAPALAGGGSAGLPRRAVLAGRLLACMALGLALGARPFRIELYPWYPARSIDFMIANDLQGNVLAPFDSGSYLIWRLYPGSRVAMDGRYETVYRDSTYVSHQRFFRGGGDGFLDEYPHDIVVTPRNVFVEASLARRPGWVLAYSNEAERVYVRSALVRPWKSVPAKPRTDPFATEGMPSYPR